MFIVQSLPIAIAFCVVTMLGWGSWANTQKLAGKDRWPFELYYWDYAIGVMFLALLFTFTLGSLGSAGPASLSNLGQAATGPLGHAFLSGILFNVANILLVVAIDAAGMSVAFPVGVGLALVIGTIGSYLQSPKGNAGLLFAGVSLIVAAMILSALAYRKLPQPEGRSRARGLAFAVTAGCLMGLFYPQLTQAISPDFRTGVIRTGYLTPYTALLFFGLGLLVSNVVVNTVFMKVGGWTYSSYLKGSLRLHFLGFLGGIIWMLALSLNILAAGVAGPAISYALGQGATLVAAIWGVFIWREFRDAPGGTMGLVGMMFAGYTVGLVLVGMATL